MRIGIFTDTYFPQVSGVATSIRVLKEELERRGHTVIIFTTTDPKATMPEWDIVRLGSIPLFAFKERRIAVQGFGEAYKVAKKYDLDIIHTQTEFSLGMLGKALGGMLGIPTIHTYHTMYEKYLHYIANGRILRPSHVAYISKNFCNQTKGVIAPSQMTKDKLISYGVTEEIRVIPTGVEIPKLNSQLADDLRKDLGYDKDDVILLSLSRLSKEKNIAAVIASLPQIVAENPKVKCLIVGGGPEKEILESQVSQLQLENVVQFAGEINHDQVSQFYQMADLYVNASESESQGLTYLEALVNRIPVIAKKNDYLAGLVTNKSLGMLFENDEEIARTVLDYLKNRGSQAEVNALQEQLLHEISAETFGERVLDFYQSAIANYHHEKEQELSWSEWFEKMNFFKIYNEKERVKRIGFIGTGVMGSSMVKHLLEAGYPVTVYNRTKSKTEELLAQGAIWAESPQAVAEDSDVVLSIVGYPKDVEEIYFGEKGLFKAARPGMIFIDLTTSTPSLAKKIAEQALELECEALDAPVSGGDLGAKNGTLSTMVGGEESVLEEVRPILETFSKTITWQGPAGSGQHTKMANQIMIAGTMTGLVEMLVYAKAAGLDLEKVLQTVGTGSAANWSLLNYGPRILQEDYSPGFFAKHFLKDLGIAIDEAEKMRLFLPATLQARKLYETLCDDGFGDEGTQALIKLYWTLPEDN